MSRDVFCYLFHRRVHTVLFAVGLPWPLERVAGYEWWCPRCNRSRGKSVRVFGATPLGVPA